MKNQIHLCLLAIAMLSAFGPVKASDNECKNFHIQIANLSNVPCILTSQRVIHGNLITSPPLSIMPDDSKRFDMSQTGFAPSISLSFQCGSENITFKSRQGLCLLVSGNISGEILTPFPVHINATYVAFRGSHFWKRAGSINWRITNTLLPKPQED